VEFDVDCSGSVKIHGAYVSDLNVKLEDKKSATAKSAEPADAARKQAWETPKLEEVSEQVMAQPYIRFT
jgi:hypothetical protein